MKIYIDESGSFTVDKQGKEHSISCNAALIIPEIIEDELFCHFEKWKKIIRLKYGFMNNEIKGSMLKDEEDFKKFLLMLVRFDIILEVDVVDLGFTSNDTIEKHKGDMAEAHARSISGQKNNEHFNRDIIKTLSNPNYVQALSISSLVTNTLKTSINYYIQRFPPELKKFQWILDAKNENKINSYEEVLVNLIKPLVQTKFINEPSCSIKSVDYSYLNEYMIDHNLISISDIMKEVQFLHSHDNPGLQIIDMLVNCMRRAMSDRLQFQGWKYLSGLIIKRKSNAISITRFDGEMEVEARTVLANFVNYFNNNGKHMLVPDQLSKRVLSNKKGYMRWSYLDEMPENSQVKKTTYEYY